MLMVTIKIIADWNMVQTIQHVVFVRDLQKLYHQFWSRCLLYKHTKGGYIVRRPWDPTDQATRRNEVLHYDFLYMGDSKDTTFYVLVPKDGLTHICELIACDSLNSDVAVQALQDWSKRFGAPEILMLDTGSHFKKLVVDALCQRLSSMIRVMLMEFKLDTGEWVYLLPLVQSNLYYTVVPSLNNHTPSEPFTLLPVPNLLTRIGVARSKNNLMLDVSVQRDNVDDLRKALHVMLRE
ncbi:unnamed protein product [Phytophthora fragariaefolia]|uniref:Unnamed protein product n=1 Tax=Phytophthora fragariaefolia TaxID=1490495 RepID=A0A9W6U8L9_9STRA|nr:unnamed protein product [Phytophthora fragariaefolia]